MPGTRGAEGFGTLARLFLYPVKSMRGEECREAVLASAGMAGDRLYAFDSAAAPPGMLRVAGRERRELLRYAAIGQAGTPLVRTPAGETFEVTDPALLTRFPGFSAMRLTVNSSPQTDVRPLSLLSLQTVDRLGQELGCTLDPRRFRANLYLDLPEPFGEDNLVGRIVRLGSEAVLHVSERIPRCRFITLDPETTEPLPALMSLLHRRHQSRAGVYARVLQAGAVRVGDALVSVDTV